MFHARYHDASKVIQKDENERAAEEAASKKRKSEEAQDDFKWALATETALGKLMPKMKATISRAELIESANKTLELKDKWHKDKAVEQHMELQNEVMQAEEMAMTESGARK